MSQTMFEEALRQVSDFEVGNGFNWGDGGAFLVG